MAENMKLQRKGNFQTSDRQSTHRKSVDPGQYPYKTIDASLGYFVSPGHLC